MEVKSKLYNALVNERKRCHICDGLRNPSEKDLKQFDSDEIGPWSRLHGDLSAKLMIVGQDWGGVPYFLNNHGLDKLNNPTMKNLEKLLHSIGFNVSLTHYTNTSDGLFLTNAILCLKDGGLQAPVESTWFSNCQKFLHQLIEIVSPVVVVGLGERAFIQTAKSFNIIPQPLKKAILDRQGLLLENGTKLFAAYHCGRRTINKNRSFDKQLTDWKRIERVLKHPSSLL